MAETCNRLDPQSFREWCDARLADPRIHPQAIGGQARLSATRLAEDLGLTEDALRKWRREYEALDRAKVEDALHRVGIEIWTLYPELHEELEAGGHRWCPDCKEAVPTTAEKLCLWCDRRCYFEAKPDNAAPLRKLSDKHLRSLHRIYAEGGLTLLGLARRIWRQAGYASERSARNGLKRGFVRLGLEVFPQQARTGISFCEETVRFGPRKGQPCGLPKRLGSSTCVSHGEDRSGERAKHLAAMRARRKWSGAPREVAA